MKITPVLCAALGAAAGFYAQGAAGPQPRRVLILLFVAVTLASTGRVLALEPGVPDPEVFPGAFRRGRRIHRRALALAAGIVLGIAASAASLETLPRTGLPAELVQGIAGILDEDPRESVGGRGMGALSLRYASGAGGLRVDARGRVLVFFPAEALPRLRDFGRGAEVFVEGSFVPDAAGSGGLFRARSTHIVRAAPAREQRRTGIRLALLEKLEGRSWGGLGAALLLGVKDNLDSGLAADYRNAGCSHVLALSGMHLAIVAALAAFFLRRPLGLKAAAVFGAALILLYTGLVGVQPSLERAAVMYLLGAAAVVGFLPRQPLSLLAMTFVIQLVIRPSAGNSLSFILSYLALGGILTMGEFLHGLFRGRLPEFLASPLSASLGAYLTTQAVVAGFGVVRPSGAFAGLLIVPLTTVFMIAVIAVLPISFAAPFLMRYLDRGLSLFYALLERVVSLAALAPGLAANGWAREFALTLLAAGLCLYPGYPYSIRRRSLAPFT
jgi:competence protein ComEC